MRKIKCGKEASEGQRNKKGSGKSGGKKEGVAGCNYWGSNFSCFRSEKKPFGRKSPYRAGRYESKRGAIASADDNACGAHQNEDDDDAASAAEGEWAVTIVAR